MDCKTCAYRCPDIMPGNIKAYYIRNLTINCMRYSAGFPVSFDWTQIDAVCRMARINIHPLMMIKLKHLEAKALETIAKKAGEKNGEYSRNKS